MSNKDIIVLNDYEIEVVRRVLEEKKLSFDNNKRTYSIEELLSIGIVRESYSLKELYEKNIINSGVVTSFDDVSERAKKELKVNVPFSREVEKWQLPIDLPGIRLIKTVFQPNTVVLPHVHQILDPSLKNGGFRMVVQGSIHFEDKNYLPGDWFFVPNGIPYSFKTDPDVVTMENYLYMYGGPADDEKILRISNPKPVE